MARHLRTWKVKSIFVYSGFFIRNLKPRAVIPTTEYLCLLGALGNVCRQRLVVTTEVGGVTTGLWWVETREAAEHTPPPAKDRISCSPSCQVGEKPALLRVPAVQALPWSSWGKDFDANGVSTFQNFV